MKRITAKKLPAAFVLLWLLFTHLVTNAQLTMPLYGLGDDQGKWWLQDSVFHSFSLRDSTIQIELSGSYYRAFDKSNHLLLEGQLNEEYLREQMLRHGLWKEYYSNQVLKSAGNYEMNNAVGIWRRYHPNGSLSEIYNIAPIIVDSSIQYLMVSGYEAYYDNGKPRITGYYRAISDTSVLIYRHFKDTTNTPIDFYSKAATSKPTGLWTWYKPDGTIEKTKDYSRFAMDSTVIKH